MFVQQVVKEKYEKAHVLHVQHSIKDWNIKKHSNLDNESDSSFDHNNFDIIITI